jgi:RNA polymerase sigma factor (sigma-70 family)
MPMPPDAALIESARAGDPVALERVLAHSRQHLRRYAEFHCVINDVEDAVQEALLLASRKLHALRDATRFTSWLFRIVKRECNRLHRGQRWLTNHDIEDAIQPLHLPDPAQLRVDIGRAMARLPAHYREILLLRDVDGLTLDETGRALGLELAATKSRLHRARVRVRELLGEGALAER